MRTEEQIAADEALTAAVEATALAYGVMEPNDVTQEYVFVVALQRLEDEEVRNSYTVLYRDGAVSGTRAVGLLECTLFDLKMGRAPDA